MRQQQTGMYWQTFILTEIVALYLEKVAILDTMSELVQNFS
jgi:hypothetical protein